VPPEAAEKMQAWHACSDGVTIDTTPPKPALVRLGAIGMEGTGFSSNRQELSVTWGNFADIEEMVRERMYVYVCVCVYVCVSPFRFRGSSCDHCSAPPLFLSQPAVRARSFTRRASTTTRLPSAAIRAVRRLCGGRLLAMHTRSVR
jgi:hypothetical protein